MYFLCWNSQRESDSHPEPMGSEDAASVPLKSAEQPAGIIFSF
jgi:hypothetical protein